MMEQTSQKMTPETLMQLRQGNGGGPISDETIAKFYASQDTPESKDFSVKLKTGSGKYNITGKDGKPMQWPTVALNMEVYGNPYGDQQEQANAAQDQGFLGNVTDRLKRGFGDKEQRAGRAEVKGLSQGVGAAIRDIPGDIADVVGPALPVIGGIVGAGAGAVAGAPAGPAAILTGMAGGAAGAAAGEEARASIGHVLGVNDPGSAEALKEKGTQAALGAAGELVGPALRGASKLAGPVITKTQSLLTNVPKEVLGRAYKNPEAMKIAIKEVAENTTEPFLPLARQVGNTLMSKISGAKKSIETAKKFIAENNPGARFDVSASVDDLTNVLKKENLSLAFEPTVGKKAKSALMNAAGQQKQGLLSAITQGPAKPLEKAELEALQEYIDTVANARDFSFDDVLDMKKLYTRIYKKIGENSHGTVSNGQRILKQLRKTVDDKISTAMPDNMKAAYKEFSDAMGMLDDFPAFVTDNNGKFVLSESGERYLNTLWSTTGGQRRADIQALSKYLGVDITGKMQLLKDARKLSEYFPSTGSRTQDIIRALFITSGGAGLGAVAPGIGTTVGAKVGAGLAAAASSPLLAGQAQMTAGKFAKNKTVQGVMKLMNKMAPAEKAALLQFINGARNPADNELPSQEQ